MASDTEQREHVAMKAVADRLTKDFSGERDTGEIRQVIGAAYQRYERAPIRDFIPILVERAAREELRAAS